MNHIYKVIWNTITQTWVAVSELSRAKGKTKSSKTLSAVVLAAVSAGAIVGGTEAAMFAGQGDGISIQSQKRNTKVAKAEGVTAIAIGYDVSSKGTSALAIGTQTHASGEKTVAIGHLSTATGSESAAFGVNATAKGNGDIALGKHAVAQGGANGVTGSAALGDEAKATGAQSAAVGGKSNASGSHAVASGYNTQATGGSSSAIGDTAEASGNQATAVGVSSEAKGNQSAALGMAAHAHGSGSVAAGVASQATQEGTTAIGGWTEAKAQKATAVGDSAHANANRATALGHDSQATGEFSTATGVSSRASGLATVAIGKSAKASGSNAIATGNSANATGTDSIASGRQASATGTGAVATGADASASGNAAAYGNKAKATGGWSSAFGNEAKATQSDASAFGNSANAGAQNATAVGAHSNVTASGGTALGRGSSVAATDGVALGNGAVADRAARDRNAIVINTADPSKTAGLSDNNNGGNANTVYAPVHLVDAPEALTKIKETIKGNKGAVSVGDSKNTRQIINVAAGSADSDAVNVAQLKAVAGSIKKYQVTSPDGSINITNPTPGQDPQNFQISMNTTKVQDAAQWYVKEGTETSGTAVRGGNTVSFNDSSTIDVKHNSRNFTFDVKSGDVTTNTNTGAITAPTDGNVLAKAKNVAEAIQRSGWELQANGTKVGLINPGDKVNIKPGTGVTITPTNEAGGVSTLTISAAQQNYSWKLKEDSQTPAQALNVTNNTAVSLKGENFLNITNKGGGNFAFKTVTKDVAYTATTGEVNAVSSATGLVTNKNLSDVIRNSGFQLKENGTLKNVVNPGESLNFKPGQGTKVSVSANGDVQVNADTGSIVEVSPSENADNTPKKGQVKAGSNDENKIATVSNVANAINKAKWFAKADNNGGEIEDADKANDAENADGQAMGAGDKLTLKAGKNLRVKRDGANFTFATNNDVTFNKVTSNEVAINNGGKFTVGSGATINMGGNVVGGVANGVADTDAVNVAQLKANTTTVAAGKNVTVTPEITNNGRKYTVDAEKSIVTATGPVTVTPTPNDTEHTTTYNVGLDIDNDSLVVEGGKLKAKTQAQAVESVEKKEGNDNIAEVDVKTGEQGKANAVYTVAVTKSAVKEAAAWKLKAENGEAQTVSGGDTVTFKNSDTINATVSADKEVTLTANTGSIVEVSPSENADNTPKKGQVKAGSNDENKIATVSNVANAINKAKWFAKADNNGGEIEDADKANDAENADGQAMGAGDKLTLKAGKNLRVKRDGANFTFATNNDVTFNKVTSNEVAINNGGKFTVGSGATINMGGNVVGGVANGVADTDAVNVAQLKANTTTVAAGKNVTVTPEITNNGRKYTVDAEKSIVTATGPVTVTPTPNDTEHTTTYNVGLDIDNDSLVVEGGKLKAKIKDYSFKTNATGSNLVGTGTDTTVASGKSVNFAASDNLTLKQDVNDGNVTYTYGLKNQVVVGEKGTPGKDGIDGSIGVNGRNGSAVAINGKDGSIGLNGENGKNGLTIKGQDGKVGVDGKDGETRLVYVEKADPTKPGSTDKTHKLATLDDGQKYAGDNYVAAKDNQAESNVIAKKSNERLDILGGAKGNLTEGNIGVNAKDGKLHVQLAEKVNLGDKGSVTIGDTVVNNNGITINSPADLNGVTNKTVSLTNQGLNNGGNKITNVAEGENDTDAVNVKQLKDFKTKVADGGLTFAGNSGTAHKAKLNTTVNIKGGEGNTDATQFDNGKNVMTAVNGNTVTVSIKKTPEVEGINITDTTGNVKVKLTQTNEGLKVSDGNDNATRITNVKAGEKDTDAVNVKQLKAAKTEVEAGDDHINVTSTTGANGQTIYKVSAKGINDTSAAVKAGSNHVEVTKAANTHKDGSTTVTDYTVDLSDKTKGDIGKGVKAYDKVTNEGLTFNADKGSTGVKKLGSNVAVNGDGKNITTTADENGVKVSMKDDIKVNSVTAKEVKVGDVNINENGINAGGKRITNVAPGKDGTDAVNVNQLKYVAGNISNQINNVDKGLRAGIAGALASGGLYHVTTAGKSMVSVGAGTYRGQNALAVGYSRLSDNGKVGVKFTVNSNSQGHAGASASVGYQW